MHSKLLFTNCSFMKVLWKLWIINFIWTKILEWFTSYSTWFIFKYIYCCILRTVMLRPSNWDFFQSNYQVKKSYQKANWEKNSKFILRAKKENTAMDFLRAPRNFDHTSIYPFKISSRLRTKMRKRNQFSKVKSKNFASLTLD